MANSEMCAEWAKCPTATQSGCRKKNCFTTKGEATESSAPSSHAEFDLLCGKPGPQCKYWEFYNSVTCLFAEGVEFMTKSEIYDAIKKDWTKLTA